MSIWKTIVASCSNLPRATRLNLMNRRATKLKLLTTELSCSAPLSLKDGFALRFSLTPASDRQSVLVLHASATAR
jgi:hypothetical protein